MVGSQTSGPKRVRARRGAKWTPIISDGSPGAQWVRALSFWTNRSQRSEGSTRSISVSTKLKPGLRTNTCWLARVHIGVVSVYKCGIGLTLTRYISTICIRIGIILRYQSGYRHHLPRSRGTWPFKPHAPSLPPPPTHPPACTRRLCSSSSGAWGSGKVMPLYLSLQSCKEHVKLQRSNGSKWALIHNGHCSAAMAPRANRL